MSARKLRRASPKQKVASINEMATADFQPVEPGQQSEMNDVIKFHANILILAFSIMNQPKEKLVAMWLNDDLEEASQKFVQQLIATQKWLEDIKGMVHTAEVRMMVACAASEQKDKVA